MTTVRSHMARRKGTGRAVRKKKILRLHVHAHHHRRYAGAHTGKHTGAHLTRTSAPAASSGSYISQF